MAPFCDVLGGGDERYNEVFEVAIRLRLEERHHLCITFVDHEAMIDNVMDMLGHRLFDVAEIEDHAFVTLAGCGHQFAGQCQFKTVPMPMRVPAFAFVIRDAVSHIPLNDLCDLNHGAVDLLERSEITHIRYPHSGCFKLKRRFFSAPGAGFRLNE